MSIRDKILEWRTILELFPRCVKCDGDMRDERLSNLVLVVGRDRRLMHGSCPRPTEKSNAA